MIMTIMIIFHYIVHIVILFFRYSCEDLVNGKRKMINLVQVECSFNKNSKMKVLYNMFSL